MLKDDYDPYVAARSRAAEEEADAGLIIDGAFKSLRAADRHLRESSVSLKRGSVSKSSL